LQKFFTGTSNPVYSVYASVWKYLHEMLPNTRDVLKKSARSIAEDIKKMYGDKLADGHVSSALSAMAARTEGHAPLIARASYASGISITCDVRHLRTIRGTFRGLKNGLVDHLIERCATADNMTGIGEAELVIDTAFAAKLLGANELAVKASLRGLKKQGHLGMDRPFTGKTTRILQYNADLYEALPMGELLSKGRRAFRRLDTMIGYTNCVDEQARVEYIRRYFQDGCG
ncbi:hypothetical protein DRQ25_13745, partial [Candidatus Fermentibacteria bacterium]